MKRSLFAAIALAGALFLSACEKTVEYTVSTATLASSVLQLDASLNSTAGTVASRAQVFNESERQVLTQARNDVTALQATLQSLIRAGEGATQVLVDADTLARSFTRTRDSYRAARDVVVAHLEAFTPAEVAELRRFNALALRLNASIESLTRTPDGNDVSHVLVEVIGVAADTARVLAIAGVL